MKNIANKQNTLTLLDKYNLKALKKYGQNFLVNPSIIERIATSADIHPNTTVIEIGPGLGGLTEALCEKAGQVIAYEIDERMVHVLQNELDYQHLIIEHQDFMKVDLNKVPLLFDDVVVVTNLPYYITSDIIKKVMTSSLEVRTMVALVQKEVAEKMTSNEVSPLSLIIDKVGDIEYLFTVPRDVFIPAPHVDSAVIKINKYENIDESLVQLLKVSFNQKRKTINNNLKSLLKENTSLVLERSGVDPKNRPEQLSIEEYIRIDKERNNL